MVDPYKPALLREAIEQFYFAYRAFTAKPDKILETRGLGRVHHRILYFVAHRPGMAVHELLTILGVSKQALNAPLRQLLAMKLLTNVAAEHDRRVKQLRVTDAGARLEALLTQTQLKHLGAAFEKAGAQAPQAWMAVMNSIAES
jgi:DNA-binding MarR family transcriptional regulator